MNSKIAVMVLAGGKNSPEMEAATGVSNRALVRLGEQTMLERVVAALNTAAQVDHIFVVGDVPPSDAYRQIAPGKTLLENLMAGVQAAQSGSEKSRVLVSTSDIPFLTAIAVDDFVAQSVASGADFCYPIVPMEIYRERFASLKRTTLRLREGTFTGGNLMLVNPGFLVRHQQMVQQAYAARKSPVQLGRLLGWGLLGRLLLSQTVSPSLLTIARLENGVSRLLGGGCRAAAIQTRYPEIGTDVDKPDDVHLARQMLAGQILAERDQV